jgi:hypothetical protein
MGKDRTAPLMKGMPNGHSKMPAAAWEKSQEEMGETSDLKYTNKPNPEALSESQRALANYAKKNQMKY